MSERRYYAGLGERRGPDASAREAVARDGRVELAGSDVAEVRELPSRGTIRRVLVSLGGRSAIAFAERRDGRWHVELEGRAFAIRVEDERTHQIRELTEEIGPAGGEMELRAPMPGLVVRVAVAPGDRVEAGDGLVVMEAMKMENELRAEQAGIVAEVHVDEGSTVDRDDRLVTFETDVEST